MEASQPIDEDQNLLLAAVEKAGISSRTDTDLKKAAISLQDEDVATPSEIVLAAALEMVLEISTNVMSLGPLYSLSQPFALLKTRWQYRDVEAVPAPKFEEVDEMGNTMKAQRKSRPIAWRRIMKQEGVGALWKGWACRVIHASLWRAATVTGWELLLYLPGQSPLAMFFKLLVAMTTTTLVLHPLQVVECRIMAGMRGYAGRGVGGGLVRVLKDDDALQGVAPSLLHGLLAGPVGLSYLSLGWSVAWSTALYPLDRRAVAARLTGPLERVLVERVCAAAGSAIIGLLVALVEDD